MNLLRIVALALLVSAASAQAARAPRLEPAQARQLALAAAQFHPSAGAAYEPDSRLTVGNVRLRQARRGLVWAVHVHADVAIFPCRLPPPGAPAPGCALARSQDALVTLADATGRVLAFAAIPSFWPAS